MTATRFLLFLLAFGATVLAQTRMIPHVTPVNGNFRTSFILANAVGISQELTLTPFANDGTPLTPVTLELEPFETRFQTTPELFPEGGVSHFMIVDDDQINITVAYQDAAGANSAAHLGVSDTQAVRWRIYPGALDDVLDGIAVVNMDDQSRDIQVRQVANDGGEISRVVINTLEPKAKGLYLFQDFDKRGDAYFEIFSEGPLALTALRFSTVGDGARFFWETAAAPLPQLVETGNMQPVITGQTALNATAGEPLTITLDYLTVSDSDNAFPADFTLTVGDGDNYDRAGAVVTPHADFAGPLTIPVTVNDGVNDSEVYPLQVTVTAAADPRIGRTAVFRNNPTYGISGRAVIVSERLIRLEQFNYNGAGPDVRVYLGVGGRFTNGIIITDSINGVPRQNATVELPLPDDVTLDDFDSISIWCTVFSFSFSEGVFE